jgi:hypothetical protein
MTGDRDVEARLRRHLAAEAEELPFLLDAEMMRPRLSKRRRRWVPLALVPVAAALVIAIAVGEALETDRGRTDPGGQSDPGGPVEWGPLAVAPSTGGAEALNSGVLRITDRCVVLETAGGEPELLVWPADRTRWDAADKSIGFSEPGGRQVTLANGLEVSFSGGGDGTAESGVSGAEWASSVDWVAAPDAACPMEIRWYVGEVVSAVPVGLELPTGTFVSEQPFDGICVALTIRTPDALTHATQWWGVGASGDCRTRTSDIVTTLADFSEAPAMTVGIPLMGGGTHDIRLRLTGIFDDEIRFARSG